MGAVRKTILLLQSCVSNGLDTLARGSYPDLPIGLTSFDEVGYF